MSDELLRQLRDLEEEYLEMPPAAQQADLPEINRLRQLLKLPQVNAQLQEVEASDAAREVVEKVDPSPEPSDVDEHAEARKLYAYYLKRMEVLTVHRDYAARVAKATEGHGQTPVKPLATLGNQGGALLCDHCKKPIVLEGGEYNGVYADEAWEKNPQEGWRSWILGGMVVQIQTNGTLRIYHGYSGRDPKHCCNIAASQDRQARSRFDTSRREGKWPMILKFIEHEFPDLPVKEQNHLLNDILDVNFEFDPGIGVNQPDEKNGG